MIGSEKVYNADEIAQILDGEVKNVMQQVLGGNR